MYIDTIPQDAYLCTDWFSLLYCKYFCFQKPIVIYDNGCQETDTQFYYVYVGFSYLLYFLHW